MKNKLTPLPITPAGRWAIVETWNGDGYSCGENRADLFCGTFDEARAEARRKAREMKIGEYLEREDDGAFLIGYEGCDDSQGTIQAIPLGPDHVGVVIYCNTNEAKVVDASQWAFELAEAIAQSDGEPIEDLAPFIGAYDGDVDYQFVALNLRCEHCQAHLEDSCGEPFCRTCGKPTPDFAQY